MRESIRTSIARQFSYQLESLDISPKVRSIVKEGCSREASVEVIAVSVTLAALLLVVMAILIYRWKKSL